MAGGVANGAASLAFDGGTTNASHAIALGWKSIASGNSQTALGKYNSEDTEDKYAVIVGNGTLSNKRRNAHTLDWEGNAWFAGDVTGNVGEAVHKLSEKANQTFVEEKLAEIGGGGQEQWRLINEVTLTEDAVVEFTTDADGNPFEVKKMRILVRIPKLETQSQLWLKTDDYIAVYSDNIPTSANTPTVSIDGELKNSWIFTTCYVASGSYNSGQVKSFPSGSRLSNGENVLVNPIKKITLAFGSNMTTPVVAGTRILFWGVDA